MLIPTNLYLYNRLALSYLLRQYINFLISNSITIKDMYRNIGTKSDLMMELLTKLLFISTDVSTGPIIRFFWPIF